MKTTKSTAYYVKRLHDIDIELEARKKRLREKKLKNAMNKNNMKKNNVTSIGSKAIKSDIDKLVTVCKKEFIEDSYSQTAINYIKEHGLNTTLSIFTLRKSDFSNEFKKKIKKCQLLMIIDKVDNYNRYKLENQAQMSIIDYLEKQKIKKTSKKVTKKEAAQDDNDSKLFSINGNIDNHIAILETLNNESSNNSTPVNTVKKIEIEDYDNYNYNYSNEANLINISRLTKIKQIREDIKELLTEKINYLYKVYNVDSLIELQIIASNNNFLTDQLNEIDQINIEYNFFKGSTKNVKKQLTKDLPLLKFSDDKNLDLIPILDGLDSYVKYFLKDRKVYNYVNFCETYDININELRNEANLVILENLEKIEDKIGLYGRDSYCELSKEDKKAVNSLIANILRKKIDNFCQIVSNAVTIPVDEYSNFNKLRQAKRLSSMQSTSYELEKRLAKTRQKTKRSKIIPIQKFQLNKDGKVEMIEVKEVLLKDNNQRLYRSNYYTSIIEPLNKNIEIKEACTNKAPVLKIDKKMIEIMQSYYILDLKFFEKLSNKQIAKILKIRNCKIKDLLEDSLKACQTDLHDYLYHKNLKSALKNKINSELMQKLTSLIY